MKARVIWYAGLEEVLAEMPRAVSELIFEKIDLLVHFPRMYPLVGRGRFRRHRRFVVDDWIVYYRVVGNIFTSAACGPPASRKPLRP